MAEIVASSEVSGTEQLVHSTVSRSAQFDSVACTTHLGGYLNSDKTRSLASLQKRISGQGSGKRKWTLLKVKENCLGKE